MRRGFACFQSGRSLGGWARGGSGFPILNRRIGGPRVADRSTVPNARQIGPSHRRAGSIIVPRMMRLGMGLLVSAIWAVGCGDGHAEPDAGEDFDADRGVDAGPGENGARCRDDGDCNSGHCDNDYCCESGSCCRMPLECPLPGGLTAMCEDETTCQGSRGEVDCVRNMCVTELGVADDTACGATIMALECEPYVPVFCNGMPSQPVAECPTTCMMDDECIAAAHCSGECVMDLPAGSACARSGECVDGLTCADGVCCNETCDGDCRACDTMGMRGTCVDAPAGMQTCGMGECAVTTEMCLDGDEVPCTPGMPGT